MAAPFKMLFFLRQARVDPDGPVIGEDDHAWFGAGWFLYIADRDVVNRYVFGGAALAVVGCNGCSLEDILFGQLCTAALDDDMGTRDVLGMEPCVL